MSNRMDITSGIFHNGIFGTKSIKQSKGLPMMLFLYATHLKIILTKDKHGIKRC
jgi:hypothetical protein